MATTTRTATRSPASKQASTLEHLQRALDELDKARVHAQADALAGIDAAVERIRDAADELRSRASAEAREFEQRLASVSEARRELARKAAQAQRTREALTALSSDLRRRKRALGA